MVAHADVPTGDAAKALPLCDLVMKGGVTSGLVYPSMITRLATRYRFANVGGSSAGAIAAALCAAAEYGRQTANGGGLHKIDAAAADLGRPGVLRKLFQPTPEARPLFEVIQGAFLAPQETGVLRRVFIAARATFRRRLAVAAAGVVLIAALVVLAYGAFGRFPTALAVVLAVTVALLVPLVLVATVLVAAGLLVQTTLKSLRDWDFGMCPGTNLDNRADPAVIDWLHTHIQDCAGRTTADDPLTFGDLDAQGIHLTMLTTDLSFARPVRVPEGIGTYRFDPDEMRKRFPPEVAKAMIDAGEPQGDGRYKMPTAGLPVLVGVRLSLSFPLLLSAMPLYWSDDGPDAEPRRHLFSDGGIGSNFPVHLFDVWFPGRPTFAIDLVDYPEGDRRDVAMLDNPKTPLIPRWREVTSLPAFVGDITDAMQNWRDNLQSELPGFRDRVCQIRLDNTEGGLHLNMSPERIKVLVERGKDAGDLILKTFDAHQWDQHRFVRYLTLMGQIQDSLHRADQSYRDFAPKLEQGLPGVNVYRDAGRRDTAWCQRAGQATASLLALGAVWGPPPLDIDFLAEPRALPDPVMRVVPKA